VSWAYEGRRFTLERKREKKKKNQDVKYCSGRNVETLTHTHTHTLFAIHDSPLRESMLTKETLVRPP